MKIRTVKPVKKSAEIYIPLFCICVKRITDPPGFCSRYYKGGQKQLLITNMMEEALWMPMDKALRSVYRLRRLYPQKKFLICNQSVG